LVKGGEPMIKCPCGSEDCKIVLSFEDDILWVRNGEPLDKGFMEIAMYLNPNTIAQIVSELKQVLNQMVFEKENP